MKRGRHDRLLVMDPSFSILERIVVVETEKTVKQESGFGITFSILERIVVVETTKNLGAHYYERAFSILERIVVVETCARSMIGRVGCSMSFSILERIVVVETSVPAFLDGETATFQYPRTDRGG